MGALFYLVALMFGLGTLSDSSSAQSGASPSFPEALRGCWIASSKEFEDSEAVDIGLHAYEQGDGVCNDARVRPHKSKSQWEVTLSCDKGDEGARKYRATEMISIQTIGETRSMIRVGHMFDPTQIVVYKKSNGECVLKF